jgi:hypothetical protein
MNPKYLARTPQIAADSGKVIKKVDHLVFFMIALGS